MYVCMYVCIYRGIYIYMYIYILDCLLNEVDIEYRILYIESWRCRPVALVLGHTGLDSRFGVAGSALEPTPNSKSQP